jgi:hypothetical protein
MAAGKNRRRASRYAAVRNLRGWLGVAKDPDNRHYTSAISEAEDIQGESGYTAARVSVVHGHVGPNAYNPDYLFINFGLIHKGAKC